MFFLKTILRFFQGFFTRQFCIFVVPDLGPDDESEAAENYIKKYEIPMAEGVVHLTPEAPSGALTVGSEDDAEAGGGGGGRDHVS